MTPATRQLIALLDPQWREYFNERAAILEYEAKLPRDEAESIAWMETSSAMLKFKIKKLSEKPIKLKIHKKVDTAVLATGEID